MRKRACIRQHYIAVAERSASEALISFQQGIRLYHVSFRYPKQNNKKRETSSPLLIALRASVCKLGVICCSACTACAMMIGRKGGILHMFQPRMLLLFRQQALKLRFINGQRHRMIRP